MEVLRATGLPVSVIAGSEDQFASVTEAEAMAEQAGPQANLTIIAGVGHLSPVEAPYLAATLLREAYRRSLTD
jgi:pimeloyl-ACP methyl ester carboxylesterase